MAEASRQVRLRPHLWHVQDAGTGPLVLLVHGAGGAAQSWRGVFPRLVDQGYRVVAVDLPGQGFTRCGARHRSGLEAMAADLGSLCRAEGWTPAALMGHSAGAAVALRMVLAGDVPPCPVLAINAALARFDGVAGWLFPRLARALAVAPGVAGLFAATAGSPASVERLLRGTGSDVDATGHGFYRRLVGDRDHVDGTLTMMSQWSVDDLVARLGEIAAPALFLVGASDKAVPPRVSSDAARRMAAAEVRTMPGGHLLHEESPEAVIAAAAAFLGAHGIRPLT